ncbi:helix-turn-helix domain-containing protein [Nonomuraea maheshkhaliensis]
MGVRRSNLAVLERRLRAHSACHAKTVYSYAEAIGHPLRPTLHELVRHREGSGQSPHDVAAAMGVSARRVRELEADLTSRGGASIQTVFTYSVITGQPLTLTGDPTGTPRPDLAPFSGQPQQESAGTRRGSTSAAWKAPTFDLTILLALRAARALTEDQIAARMGMVRSNLRRLEQMLSSGAPKLHAKTVFDYADAIGYPFRPTFRELVQYREGSGQSRHDVSALMGVDTEYVYRLERMLKSGGGGLFRTVFAYSVVIGQPLAPTEDPHFTPPPGHPASRRRSEKARTSQQELADERERLAAEAIRLHAAGAHIRDIAKHLQVDRTTAERYLNPQRTKRLSAQARHRDEERQGLAARAHQLRADGKEYGEIAELLHISEMSVYRYMSEYPADTDG